jgi:hypothetical protein
MNDSSWWWLGLLPITFLTAYYGGYLASVRNEAEAWKTRTGEVLGLLTIVCLVLVGIYTPEAPDGFGFGVFVIWLMVIIGLGTTARQGFKNRRYKSKLQICIL